MTTYLKIYKRYGYLMDKVDKIDKINYFDKLT